MNLVEQWFALKTRPGLLLEREPDPFTSHGTAEEIVGRLAGYCSGINQPDAR